MSAVHFLRKSAVLMWSQSSTRLAFHNGKYSSKTAGHPGKPLMKGQLFIGMARLTMLAAFQRRNSGLQIGNRRKGLRQLIRRRNVAAIIHNENAAPGSLENRDIH